MTKGRVLLTGATGFVGRALHPALEEAGYEVRGATRDPERARLRWPEREFVRYEASDPIATRAAMEGCQRAYYLVHAMGAQPDGEADDFETRERRSAKTFIAAAERLGVERVVYLGGIPPSGSPSKHLRSRLETGEVLRSAAVCCLELRAAMIVGRGSASWNIVRDLATRLPVMVLPKWLESESEPVWIGDVVAALVAAADDDLTTSAAFDLPGPDRLSAREILRIVAQLRYMDPWMIDVPLVTPWLSSHWISFVTRADDALAAELVEGLTSDIVSDGEVYWRRMNDHRPKPFEEAALMALAEEGDERMSSSSRFLERAVRAVARRYPRPTS